MSAVDLRYARALDEVVLEQRLSREQVKQQLESFVATYAESAELREVMEDPSIPEKQKLGVLDGLANRMGLNGTVRNFVAVVASNERLRELPEMVDAYLRMADQDGGIAEAEITSARPLNESDRRTLEESIAKLSGGSQVRATYREDASLLGGAVVKVGSTVYDGSVRGQLEQMKRRMFAATI